jgi:hypothetical protein
MARLRERHRTGRIPLLIEVDEVALAELLIEHGLLDHGRADDRLALAKAVERALDVLIRDGVTSGNCGS